MYVGKDWGDRRRDGRRGVGGSPLSPRSLHGWLPELQKGGKGMLGEGWEKGRGGEGREVAAVGPAPVLACEKKGEMEKRGREGKGRLIDYDNRVFVCLCGRQYLVAGEENISDSSEESVLPHSKLKWTKKGEGQKSVTLHFIL